MTWARLVCHVLRHRPVYAIEEFHTERRAVGDGSIVLADGVARTECLRCGTVLATGVQLANVVPMRRS